MPTYEYECTHCGHHFEMSQSIKAKPQETCPRCHKTIKRLMGTGSGIIFRGSGFYATDYRKKGPLKPKHDPHPVVCPKAQEGCNGCKARGNP